MRFPKLFRDKLFISWLAFRDCLYTVIWSRNWRVIHHFLFCKEFNETRDHLCFTCPYSYSIWTILSSNLLYSIINPDWHITTNSLLWNRLSTTDKVLIKFVFQALLYGIWGEKNGRSLGTPSSNLLSLSHILTRWFSVCNLCWRKDEENPKPNHYRLQSNLY